MIVRYLSHQHKCDPLNGQIIQKSDRLSELLNRRRNEAPFIAELSGENGFQIVFGLGPDCGCVEYTRIDGDPPYLMAVSPHPQMSSGDVEFLAANTLTSIAARYIVSFEELQQIALYFLSTGERSPEFFWETI